MSKFSEFVEWVAKQAEEDVSNEDLVRRICPDSLDEINTRIECGLNEEWLNAFVVSSIYADHCTAPLLARIAELEAAQTWQPIESAPLDGTWILVIDNTFDGLEGAFVAQRARCFGGCWLTNSFGKRDVVRATHWMPLPTPPKGDAV